VCEKGEFALKYELSEKDKQAIEKALNDRGGNSVEVSVRNGQVTIYQVSSKKIN
jgi:hypothetical protein